MKSEAQKTVERARVMIKATPALEAAWRQAWGQVLDAMEPLYDAARPVLKSFEVHHCNETIRAVMLTNLVDGITADDAAKAAIEKGKRILADRC